MSATKIVCTLGPSTEDVNVLRDMARAGMVVARLNCSHGTQAARRSRLGAARAVSGEGDGEVKVLLDLQGFRIRIGKLGSARGIELKEKQTVFLSNREDLEGEGTIPLDYVSSLSTIGAGSSIYIDDGSIALVVKGCSQNRIEAEVVVPGVIGERKGVNIPDVEMSFEGLTEKDREDLSFGVENRVDFIAQSFVRNERDILNLRGFLGDYGEQVKVVAKIENRQGIQNLDGILEVSDGIMIARGDMGVSLPIYEVPVLQKMIIGRCKERGRFVITATQMLESMTERTRPTRAEVSDVANAVLDGSDYLMLSGETAVGRHPVKVVRMMSRIIEFTEEYERRVEAGEPPVW
ncbi:MAG: pyruvate kinase [Candidatus Eiseniibacteriota bacterium]|nr:MAG: pyruvate kinase [Candidatus Eisenbacteria bacterium]